MNPLRGAGDVARRICAAALLCAAAGVSAQTIYKQVDDAGRVTYTDRPDAGTKPLPQSATISAADVRSALARNSPISSRPAVTIDASEAARRLAQAELQRDQGAAPLAGEQATGTDASAGNLLYRRRQEKLRLAVEQAQHRADETRRRDRGHR